MPKKQTPNYKKIILLAVAFLLFVAALLFVSEKTNTTNFFHKKTTNDTSSGPTPEEKRAEDLANSQAKQNVIENKDGSSSNTNTPPATNISLDIRQDNNDNVTVITKLTGFSAGTCELHITNGQKSTTLKADVIYQAEFSTCAGYSVPVNSLGKGSWQLTLTVTYSGQTAEKKTTFEVK